MANKGSAVLPEDKWHEEQRCQCACHASVASFLSYFNVERGKQTGRFQKVWHQETRGPWSWALSWQLSGPLLSPYPLLEVQEHIFLALASPGLSLVRSFKPGVA